MPDFNTLMVRVEVETRAIVMGEAPETVARMMGLPWPIKENEKPAVAA